MLFLYLTQIYAQNNLALRTLTMCSIFFSFFATFLHSLSYISSASSTMHPFRLFNNNKKFCTSSSSHSSIVVSRLKILSLVVSSFACLYVLSLHDLDLFTLLKFSSLCLLIIFFYLLFIACGYDFIFFLYF